MRKLKAGEVDVLLRLIELSDSAPNLEAMQYIVFQFDFQDYEQFIIEAPPGSIRFNNLIRVAQFYDSLGALVAAGAIDPEVIFELFPVPWGKVEPIVQGMRRELGWPTLFDQFQGLGQRYQKWWDERRKKMKLQVDEAAPPAAKTKVVSIPRPAPVARPTPAPRPAVPAGAQLTTRPGAPVQARPAGATVARPATLTPRPTTLPGGLVTRPAAARPAQPQRPAAKPAPKKSAPARGKIKTPARPSKPSKGKAKSGRR